MRQMVGCFSGRQTADPLEIDKSHPFPLALNRGVTLSVKQSILLSLSLALYALRSDARTVRRLLGYEM